MTNDIPVVILAGGLGTRLQEETVNKPKPMVKIGNFPILCHIMSTYTKADFSNFIISGGYRVDVIRSYFNDFNSHNFDLGFTYSNQEILDVEVIAQVNGAKKQLDLLKKNWKVEVVDTGIESTTAGRIFNLRDKLSKSPFFLCTYGDGVSDVNIKNVLESHLESKLKATVLAVNPPSRYGELQIGESGVVTQFSEKPISTAYINGGFFCFNSKVLDQIDPAKTLEDGLLRDLSLESELFAYRYHGFWQNMDTVREMTILENLFSSDSPPWI
jgi:glucose-1-phosphate cytidylyltransferase